MKKGNKISILGAGNVGATIAYTLTLDGMASEIVLVDINTNKAKGEAMDIIQGTALCQPVNIHYGEYSDVAGSDIVIVTIGSARKPGQTRIDLAQGNVNIVKSVMPQVAKYAPDAMTERKLEAFFPIRHLVKIPFLNPPRRRFDCPAAVLQYSLCRVARNRAPVRL